MPKSPLSRSLAVMVRTGVPAKILSFVDNVFLIRPKYKVASLGDKQQKQHEGRVIMQNWFVKQPSVYLCLDLNGLIWIAHEATLEHSE